MIKVSNLINKEKREDWIRKKNMKAFTLINPDWAISEIDIIIDSPVDYKEAIQRVNYVMIAGTKVPVAAIDDLIKMKEDTDRKQDKADIRYLKKLRDEKEGKERI